MLTRLKIDGFKNLDGLDVRFGPFTCLAGPNGVGKSNVFDAIQFLSALADRSLIDAALSVRGGAGRMDDIRSLFRRVGNTVAERMSFLVEMIIPFRGEDALGQPAEASMTYLRYEITLRHRIEGPGRLLGGIEIVKEELKNLNKGSARRDLGFHHSKKWRDSAVQGRRTSKYISTEGSLVCLHGDSKGGITGGRPRKVPAHSLPRTMLSSVNNAAEHRTLVLVRQEMRSWIQLQLEPSALRAPDSFTSPNAIASNGAHIPATLHYLSQIEEKKRSKKTGRSVYATIANRLSELCGNVKAVSVDVDQKRQLLSVVMTDMQGTPHLASSLSDGTLRFLALSVMEADPSPRSVVCLEEPENGMHPQRVKAMLQLLEDLAVDTDESIGDDNPLRQIIINTHSPSVVAEVSDDSLLIAEEQREGRGNWRLNLSFLPGTWRTIVSPGQPAVSRGLLQGYLNPIAQSDDEIPRNPHKQRVKDRPDLQMLLPFPTVKEV